MTLLSDLIYIVEGPLSDRPAANAVPGKQRGWYDTDSDTLAITNGVAWIDIGPGGGAVDSVFGRTGVVSAATSDYDAAQVDFTPAGTISATDVQAAIEEVAAEAGGGVPTSRTLTAGAALTGGGDLSVDRTFDVAVDGATIEVSSDALRVKAGGIGATELASTAVTPATYGDSTHVAQVAVDADGRITGASNVTITGAAPTGAAGGVLDGTFPNPGLAAGVAGAGLAETSDVLSVNVDASTIEINADTLRVKADGITANEIAAGAVGASELASTAVAAASYGDSSHVATFTVDADGRLTAASSVAIPGVGTGGSVKLYDYEVTGSDKASIDTAVDGTTVANFAGYDILEVWLLARTDQAATVFSTALMRVNNDSSSIYDLTRLQAINTTVGGATVRGTAQWTFDCPGAGASANYYAVMAITFPFHTGTVAYKIGTMKQAEPDSTAANNASELIGLAFRSTAALTRIAVLNSSTFKFKVGTRLIVFGR